MKKPLLLLLTIIVSFLSGFAVKSAWVYFEDAPETVQPRKVTGIGGIFFDYLKPNEAATKEQIFAFVQAVGRTFLPAYLPIVATNKGLSYTEQHKKWQLIRRGRYVEFNLVYDRGTRFGLETGGRIESILMSLPTHASWVYNYIPEPGSEEEKTQLHLKKKE